MTGWFSHLLELLDSLICGNGSVVGDLAIESDFDVSKVRFENLMHL